MTSRIRDEKVGFILNEASLAREGGLPEEEVSSSFIHSLSNLLIINILIQHIFIRHRYRARGWGYNGELDKH